MGNYPTKDNKFPLYLCDPEKNINCEKTICYSKTSESCICTSHKDFAQTNDNGEPIIVYDEHGNNVYP